MAGITIEGVARTFGSVRAIDDVSLAVRDGEFFTLLGPSGCGKTTLLRMVAGFCDLDRGRILFGERRIDALPPHRRNAGMVFQNYAIFPNHTVAGNVAYGLKARNVAPADIERRVARALKLVHLDGYAERWPHQLSGGQLQRVAIARALVIEPEVLLLDEPLSNLDAKLRHDVRLEIRQLQRDLGLTTVFVTHDQEEALTVADRLVVMNQGVIAQVGTPRQLYDAPRSAFVADFIGKSNFFEGEIAGPGLFRTRSGLDIRFAGEPRPAPSVLAVRPERMQVLRADAPTAHPNAVPGVAKVVTFLGPTTESMIELKSGETVTVHAPTAGGNGAAIHPGEPVRLAWPPEASLVLDASDRAPISPLA